MEPQDTTRRDSDDAAPKPDYAPPAIEDIGTFEELTQLSTAGAFDGEGQS